MFFCGRCDSSFEFKADLATHLRNHADAMPTMPSCATCKWQFTDSVSLHAHQLTNGHTGVAEAVGEDVGEPIYESHYCDRCCKDFDTFRQFRRHRENGKACCDANFVRAWKDGGSKSSSPEQRTSYVDRDAPKSLTIAVSVYTPSVSSVTQTYCEFCKKTFESAAKYQRHGLACEGMSQMKIPAGTLSRLERSTFSPTKGRSKKRNRRHGGTKTLLDRDEQSSPDEQPSPVQQSFPLVQQSFLPIQQSHPSAQPSTRPAQQPTRPAQHLQRPTVHADNGFRSTTDRYGLNPYSPAAQSPHAHPVAHPKNLRRADSAHLVVASRQVNHHPVAPHTVLPLSPGLAVNDDISNMQQAKFICGKIMRLMLQVDIFLHEAGEIRVGGIGWTRISVSRQTEAFAKLNSMCHLPRKLQGMEFLPAPKILQSEYKVDYPIEEFQPSPDRNPARPALDVVVISCSKILLADGCHEVVKLAAVDLLTCQVLMSHLVCTDSHISVKNWNTANTGLSSFQNIEDARKSGFKVLKGWSAARIALSKFVDKDTIVVGHNLRADLDALRLIHGRAVDVIKVIEKAAAGPLSKAQVTLDGWCRDFVKVSLKADPNFGRDCLMDAFATREIALRVAKFEDEFAKIAKSKSREYQTISRV